MSTLLQVKEHLRKRRPKFMRDKSHARNRVKPADVWRRPKGMHNKIRLKKAGHPVLVEVGYRSPAALRGADRMGRRLVLVATLAELATLGKNDAAVLAHTGGKRRLELLKEAVTRKIPVANVKDAAQAVATMENALAARKERRQKVKAAVEKKAAPKKDEKPAKQDAAKESPTQSNAAETGAK